VSYSFFDVGRKVGKSLKIVSFRGCYAVSTGKQLPTFGKIVDESLFLNCVTIKMKALKFFETSVNVYQSTRRNI
jgi:hypothetical protein